MAQLSSRLQFIYDHLLPGRPVWDLCCDHGLLGQAALASGKFPKVYFVDQVEHIMAPLKQTFGSDPHASMLCQDAGQISDVVEGTVVIAGVGGDRILQILGGLCERDRLRASRLLLGPHRSEERFLASLDFLKAQGWQQTKSTRVIEGPRQRLIVELNF